MTGPNLELAEAFNAPFTYVVEGTGSATGFDPVANQKGVPFISTELSGGANIDVEATAIGMRGVGNVMRHLGIIAGEPEARRADPFPQRYRR